MMMMMMMMMMMRMVMMMIIIIIMSILIMMSIAASERSLLEVPRLLEGRFWKCPGLCCFWKAARGRSLLEGRSRKGASS
eukprot:8437275-Karenia_brevis.AAC.1